jgi:hypothetical protein
MTANPPAKPSRNGPIVTLAVLALCFAAFLATVWNYSRTHPFANNAEVALRDGIPGISAVFPGKTKVQSGQRVVVSIHGDPLPARGGTIREISQSGLAWITLDAPLSAPPGTPATVSIDGTVGPQNPK